MIRPSPATLAHDRAGHGSPLVLLHPLGADRRVWDALRPFLTTRRELITIDLPGFGESPALDGQVPTPRALAGAVAAQLAEIGVERPHVAGNSLGGWVALELGLSGVAGSVSGIAPAGLWPEPLVPKAAIAHRLARTLLPAATWCVGTRPGRSVLLSSAVAHPRRVPARDAQELLRAYALAPDFVRVNDAMRAGRFEGLERLRCPVTLVWPDHDRLIRRPVWVPDRVRNVVLSDAGHMPMWDAPEALAEVLIAASGGEAGEGGARVSPCLQEQLAGEAS
ncbi:MAG TPA: alpha/beta fold hydrolase [Solirubrobacteraceae bacterium]|jgi:pimeloyl-ACP methyl ester carboxylesterase|nr:alpha/beta fold hydrolase [Solirubrobacteraceae bacterium]